MTPQQLRALQAPLKEHYKVDPASAQRVFRASGTLLPDRPSCRIETDTGTLVAGLHPAAGGDGNEACSGDLLLQSLVACAGVTFNVVATAMGIGFRSAEVIVEGDADFRGTLGIDKSVPVGVSHIRVRFEVDSDSSDAQLATLLQMTERFCVIYQTLKSPPGLQTQLVRKSA
jgi:uncharacterized OsmC-like protein